MSLESKSSNARIKLEINLIFSALKIKITVIQCMLSVSAQQKSVTHCLHCFEKTQVVKHGRMIMLDYGKKFYHSVVDTHFIVQLS